MTQPQRAKRRYIVIPFILFGLFFAGYSVVWMYGARIMEREIDNFVEDQRAMGNTISYEKRKLKGYPFSLRTQLDNFTWERRGEWNWSGERLYIVTLPYDVTRLILAPRKQQTITFDGKTYAVEGTVNVGLKNNSYSTDGTDAIIRDGDQSLAIGMFRGNWDLDETGHWTLLASVRQALYRDPEDREFEIPYWNLVMTNNPDAPDQVIIEGTELALTDGTKSPPTILGADGELGLTSSGQLDGELTVSLRNEQALLNVLAKYDVATQAELSQASTVLSAMSKGGTVSIEIPVQFDRGEVTARTVMGPISLGQSGQLGLPGP